MDEPIHELHQIVLNKIELLGEVDAKEYFGVSAGTISSWRNRKTNPPLVAVAKVYDETLKYNAPEATTGEKNRVELLLPMYNDVEPLFLFTLFRCCKLYGIEKIGFIPKIRTLIEEARNDLAERFLLTGSEWCIYMDCDIIFPCGSAAMLRKEGFNLPDSKGNRNAIERMMSHPADKRIIGGLYRDRRGMNKAQCEKGFSSPQDNARLLALYEGKGDSDGLEEQRWVAFGMVRIHRSVFLEMKEAAKPGGPLENIAPPKGREGDPHGFFGRSSQWRGEDIAFCRRAAEIGIKSYVDTGILLGHRGGKIY